MALLQKPARRLLIPAQPQSRQGLNVLYGDTKNRRRIIICITAIVLGCGVLGYQTLHDSKAATSTVPQEVEGGVKTGNYTLRTNEVGASGSQAVLFGSGGPTAGIKLGAAVEPDYLDNAQYANTLINYKFDSLTAENAMKFGPIEPSRNQFNWAGADKIVNFAAAHSMRVRGHTLVWHTEVPAWVNSLSNTDASAALQNHIKTVMQRYKGKVTQWDVVNEAIDDGASGALRDTVWKQKLGNDYIAQAFKWAREADPTAQLCYNDYGMESAATMGDGNNLAPKANAVLAMVKDFKARGIPIDCVGFQTHSYGDYPGREADILANIKRFGEAGVKVEITELDASGADAARYAEIGRACKASGYCSGVTTWGLDDPTSFRSQDSPLLFDGNFNPKPAYASLLDAIGHPKK